MAFLPRSWYPYVAWAGDCGQSPPPPPPGNSRSLSSSFRDRKFLTPSLGSTEENVQ